MEEFKTVDMQRYLKCGYGDTYRVIDAFVVLGAVEKIEETPVKYRVVASIEVPHRFKSKIFNSRDICQSIITSAMNKNDLWKEQFTPYDVIIIDDKDYLAGKIATQEALLSYFLTCDKTVILITETEMTENGFLPEFSSYFASGNAINITKG